MLLLTLAHSFLRKAARLKILIFKSGRFFAALNNTYISDRTLSCWYISLLRSHKGNVLSDLQSDSIKYKDFQSVKYTYKSKIGSKRIKKLIFNFDRFFAALNNTYKSAGTLVLLLHPAAQRHF